MLTTRAGEATHRDPYAVVADVVERRLDEFARTATDTIVGTISTYGAGDAGLRHDVTAHCREAYLALVAALRRGGVTEERDFPGTADRAGRRLAQGISLSDFLRAFRLTQATLWSCVQEAGRDDPALLAAAPSIVGVLMETFELGSVSAAESYLEAQQYSLADSDRLRRDLLDDLIEGRVPRTTARVGLLDAIGLRDEVPFVCVSGTLDAGAVAGADDGEEPLRGASRLLREALGRRAGGLSVVRHDELVALLPLPGASSLPALMRGLRAGVRSLGSSGATVRMGVSTAQRGLHAVPVAHHEAVTAARAVTASGVRHLAELTSSEYLTLLADPTAARLVPDGVRRFVEEDVDQGSELIETVLTYADCDLNARVVAERLHLHVNSVYHRLDRISERSGLDVRSFTGVSEMIAAIRLTAPPGGPQRPNTRP